MNAKLAAMVLSMCVVSACGAPMEPPSGGEIAHKQQERVPPSQQAAQAPQPPPSPDQAQPPKLSAASPSTTLAREQISVGNSLLTLDGCQLTVEGSGTILKHALPMPEGCTFGKTRPGGPVQVETTARGLTVLVVSSKPLGDRDCDTRVRALVVGKQGVEVSTKQQEIAMCGADGPFDTPVFITLAASAKPLN